MHNTNTLHISPTSESLRSLSGYGMEYEHRISPSLARQLLGGIKVPAMGYEVMLSPKRRRPDPFDCTIPGQLALQNISGSLVLASCTHTVDRWETTFGAEFALTKLNARQGQSNFLRRKTRAKATADRN